MQITTNFSLAEVTKSEIGQRLGISNQPPKELLPVITATVENTLEIVRSHYRRPITPNSVYRCPEIDAAIRGPTIYARWKAGEWEPKSQHTKGEAVDFEVPGIPNAMLACAVAGLCVYDQLILECHDPKIPDSGWVHVSYVAKFPRRQILSYQVGEGYRNLSLHELKRLV